MKKVFKIVVTIALISAGWYVGIRSKRTAPTMQVKEVTRIDTIRIKQDNFGITHAKVAWNESRIIEIQKAVSKEYYSYTTDTLLPALKISQKEVDRLMRINAKLEGQIRQSKIDTVFEDRIVRYESPYMQIQIINDTVAKYAYDAKIDFVDYSKKQWLFGRDQYYTDVSSPDTNFKIQGAQVYRKPFTPEHDRFKIGAQTRLEVSRFPSLKYAIKATYNPDGIVSPYLEVGRINWLHTYGSSYFVIGSEFNIYRK